MRKFIFPLLVFAFAISTQSCEKDDSVDLVSDEQPVLPSADLFLMPFSAFEDADTTGKSIGATNGRSVNIYSNWIHAVSNVLVWNSVVTLNMAIPVASFGEALKHDPIHSDGVWTWSYDFVADGNRYKTELKGKFLNEEEVQWDMYVEQENGFSKVLWYTGIVSVDRSKASWTLNRDPDAPKSYLGIEFARQDEVNASIRYTIVEEGSVEKGNYIEYRHSEIENGFDRAYDVFRAENLLEIEWNESSLNGRVKDPKEFGADVWQCWSEELTNADC